MVGRQCSESVGERRCHRFKLFRSGDFRTIGSEVEKTVRLHHGKSAITLFQNPAYFSLLEIVATRLDVWEIGKTFLDR